jgi:hypothetical protein
VPTISWTEWLSGQVGVVEVDQLGRIPELGSLDEDIARLEATVEDAPVVQIFRLWATVLMPVSRRQAVTAKGP